MRRHSPLVLAGLGALAAQAAQAQDAAGPDDAARAPVSITFGTDPGAAHPRYAQRLAYAEASGGPAALGYTASAAQAAAPQAAGTQVTVEAGDTVYAIARRFSVSPAAIIAANDLAAPYTLALGQSLTVPEGEAEVVTSTAPAERPRALASAARPAVIVAASPAEIPAARTDPLLGGLERVEADEPRGRQDASYAVRPGDTLFGLARQFDVPVASLAAANDMQAPYTLSLGQRLTIPQAAPAQPIAATAPTAPEATPTRDTADAYLVSSPQSRFAWPLRGVVVQSYGATEGGSHNDGINIAAPQGAPIRAAADGEVVYTGDELEGYGNLLLVRHEDGWVSAYGHADAITVRKGDLVRRGQVVAKVGQSGSVDAPQLHFELRHDLRPQDPIAALGGEIGSTGVASTTVRF